MRCSSASTCSNTGSRGIHFLPPNRKKQPPNSVIRNQLLATPAPSPLEPILIARAHRIPISPVIEPPVLEQVAEHNEPLHISRSNPSHHSSSHPNSHSKTRIQSRTIPRRENARLARRSGPVRRHRFLREIFFRSRPHSTLVASRCRVCHRRGPCPRRHAHSQERLSHHRPNSRRHRRRHPLLRQLYLTFVLSPDQHSDPVRPHDRHHRRCIHSRH